MKAVRFYGARDVRYEEVDAPKQMLPHQVLIKPTLCGICGTDLHEYLDGPHWTPKPVNENSGAKLPQILGHEFAAEVLEVGSHVKTLRCGDRVSIQPQIGLETDYYTRRNYPHFSSKSASVGLSWPWGGMAELAVVNEANAVRMPDSLTDAEGAMVEPAAVAIEAVDRGGVRPGDTVLVTGGGPIGMLVAMAANAAGAARVVVSEVSSGRRERLVSIGAATDVLNPMDDGFENAVLQITEEKIGVDVAIECSGNAHALNQCIKLTRAMGTVVIAGIVHDNMHFTPFDWIVKGLTLRTSLCYSANAWPRTFRMITSGKMPVAKLIDRTIEAGDIISEGFAPLMEENSDILKIMVRAS